MNHSQAQPSFEQPIRGERLAQFAHTSSREIPPPTREARRNADLPPIQRTSMSPRPLERRVWPRLWRYFSEACSHAQLGRREVPSWRLEAAQRRIALLTLVAAQTALATWSLTRTFPFAEVSYLQIAILAVFAVLFSWISFSFWSNVAGFAALWRYAKVADSSVLSAAAGQPLRARTAILMPICEEDPQRCFRAIEAMGRSLYETGAADWFDFFVLSDTATPSRAQEEEHQWQRTCCRLEGVTRVYYRRRRVNIKRKSGNLADFLRRWSRPYEYMIVLDADSLMTGEAIVTLTRAMEAAPQIGILQTTPVIVNGASLFSRVQQFASRVYGPVFGAGLHFWQLGESYYWGHNAILRIAPFVQHCGLARLPGRPPLGGEILSHDFVEAALMGRAGYEVWLALGLPGSYEESPPTLLDELKRDRRWCQGNLQHMRLLLAEGLKTGHRAIFAMGIMAYASALGWAVFLLLTTVEATVESLIVPDYFPLYASLFPTWPRWNPEWAIALASTTALLLFVPKFLSLLLIVRWGEARNFGGVPRLAAGVVLEILVSTLLAPSRMWFHAKFVLVTILGKQIRWSAQQRAGSATTWRDATSAHGMSTLAAWAWVLIVYVFSPNALVWVLPVALPLVLSIPLSVCWGSTSLGRGLFRTGLLATPEERDPPAVIRNFHLLAQQNTAHVNRSERPLGPISLVPGPTRAISSLEQSPPIL